MKEAIDKAWSDANSSKMNFVSDKIRDCRKALSRWKNKNVVNALDKIHQLQEDLEKEQSADYPSTALVSDLKRSLVEAYKKEEDFFSQRSSERWLKDGDLNTKFFHASVKASTARKRIKILKDINENSHTDETSKGETATNYFIELFKSSHP